VNFTTNIAILAIILAVVIVIWAANARQRRGPPLRQRPAGVVLAILAIIVIALCVILATRHGG